MKKLDWHWAITNIIEMECFFGRNPTSVGARYNELMEKFRIDVYFGTIVKSGKLYS